MKRILFCNQKGGVGKTLLADETAWHFEKFKRVGFIDLDQQGGAVHESTDIEGTDLVIIDTPGALQKDTRKWMEAASLIVIPTNCNRHDMIPLTRMMEIAADFDKDKIIIVFNRWNRFTGTAEFINWFNVTYPGYKTFLLQASVALTDAAARGMSITEYKPKHKAAAAIEDFMNLLEKEIGE